MIKGKVNSRREARIRLPVHGAVGLEHEVEAILDTGFTGSLTLPMAIVNVWDGKKRNILVEAAETEPLLGMALLDRHTVRLDVVAGGQVVIETLP